MLTWVNLYHRVTTKGDYVYHKDIRPDKNDVELEAQRARGGYVTGRFEREWLNSRQQAWPKLWLWNTPTTPGNSSRERGAQNWAPLGYAKLGNLSFEEGPVMGPYTGAQGSGQLGSGCSKTRSGLAKSSAGLHSPQLSKKGPPG